MTAATAAASSAHSHHGRDDSSLLAGDASGVGVTAGLVDVAAGGEVTLSVGVGVAVTVLVVGPDVWVGVAVTVFVAVGRAVSVAVAVTVGVTVSDAEPLGSLVVVRAELSPGPGVVESLPGSDGTVGLGPDPVGLRVGRDAVRLGMLGVPVT